MKKRITLCLIIICLLLNVPLLFADSVIRPSPQNKSEKDIVSIFKSKVAGIAGIISSQTRYTADDIELDVRKTDSLLAPISGEIKFTSVEQDKYGKYSINQYSVRPVIVKLHWSEEQSRWVVDRLLTRKLVGSNGYVGAWADPEKDAGFHYTNGSGFTLDEVLMALKNYFKE